MKLNVGGWSVTALEYVTFLVLLGTLMFSATERMGQVPTGEKARIQGYIVSRSGDLMQLHDKKNNELITVAITDKTRIERNKGGFKFFRHTALDVTAMLPGLTIDVEGIGNVNGQLEAKRISFTPDEFAIETAEEQQFIANSVAVQNAQSTASEGVALAGKAQYSADQAQAVAVEANGQARNAQSIANEGVVEASKAEYFADKAESIASVADSKANVAAAVAIKSAKTVALVNRRVSDLDDYTNEFEVDVFFARNKTILDDTAKKDLANLADIAKSLSGYLIEISGYSSNTLSERRDQQLSEERAAAVVQYFTEVKDVPMRRILVPVGYGRTHPVTGNTDARGRALNRRVDIKVLVNKGLTPEM